MSEENNNDEFDKRFETIEEDLKYIADSQAKSEWIRKRDQVKDRERWGKTQKQLDYITKLTGIAFEDIMFQENKLQDAGKNLQRKKS